MVSISAHYVGGWDHIYQITKAALDRYIAALKYADEITIEKEDLLHYLPTQ